MTYLSFAGMESQFRKYSHDQIDSFGVKYDYGSVMHYHRRAFSKNGRDTIVPTQAGAVSFIKCGDIYNGVYCIDVRWVFFCFLL